nr:uncharacterized protein LOC109754153 [Aegilops tauschii subsp. strangulata]
MEQDEPGDGEHSPGLPSDHSDGGDKTHKPVSGEENSPDDDAFIIPEKHLEQEDLRKRLIAIARSLKKQKQRLNAAQDTLNRRWNKVLDTEEKYGGNRHTKSYPKRKLLPEFDNEINLDSGKGYMTHGMANALFGKWEEVACDLNAASNIDCDDEINAVIKKDPEIWGHKG